MDEPHDVCVQGSVGGEVRISETRGSLWSRWLAQHIRAAQAKRLEPFQAIPSFVSVA